MEKYSVIINIEAKGKPHQRLARKLRHVAATIGLEGGYFFTLWLYVMARIRMMIIAAKYSNAPPPFAGEWLTALALPFAGLILQQILENGKSLSWPQARL